MMQFPRVNWTGAISVAIAALSISTFASPLAAACTQIQWSLYPPGACPTTASSHEVGAGDYGRFFFDQQPSGCTSPPSVSGVTDPNMPLYPAPGPAPASWSCQGGSCLTDIDLVSAPWTTVIDFPASWHAESVGATVHAAAGTHLDVAHLPFGPEPFTGCDGYTDLDLMISLAQLADKVDTGAIPAPATVNMSLGRLPQAGNPVDTNCQEDMIACQVSLLLAHLAKEDPNGQRARTALIAAFGNERAELFPASLEHVHSVASLDLAVFTNREQSVAAWESRSALSNELPEALMPGAAFCLENGAETWSPPAGSSFAAAYFSGVLTEAMAAQPALVHSRIARPGTWTLGPLCHHPGCDYLLVHDDTLIGAIPPTAALLMDSALHDDLSDCGPTTEPGLRLQVDMAPVPGNPIAGRPSLGEHVITTIKAAPQPDPCVPCTMSCQRTLVQGVLAPTKPAPRSRAAMKVAPNPRIPVLVTIDTHASWALHEEAQIMIREAYVRFDDEFQLIDFSTPQLKLLSLGQVAHLEIYGSLERLEADGQPSFVLLVEILDPKLGAGLFWKSAPMIMRGPMP